MRLTQQLGREPTNEEIAQRLTVPTRKVEEVFRAIQDPFALQTPVGDEDTELEDFIGDKNSPSPYADAEKTETSEQIQQVLKTLTPKEEMVIRISRYGLVAFASSLDQIGPMTKDVRDAACVLGVIAGHDPLDSTSADGPVPDYMKALAKKDLKKLRVGVPREFFAEGLDPEVDQAVKAAIEELKALGGEIKDIQLPRTDAAVAVYYVLATAEASSNLARFDGVKFGLRAKETKDLLDLYMKTRQERFGPEVKRRIMLGTYVLSAGYYDAYYLA